MKPETFRRLQELQVIIQNRSNKPLARLRASMAQIEYNGILSQFPGSIRKGYLRGNIAT